MKILTLEDKAKEIYLHMLYSREDMVNLNSCIKDDGCLECRGVLDHISWCNNEYQKR